MNEAGRAPILLLVDDERSILSALERSLRREGYRILTAENGESALRILAETPVDVIVSDQKMPGMSGLELLAAARERRASAARVLLTGWPEEVPSARRAALGLHALIPKPWDDAALKRTLRSAVRAPERTP